MAEATILIVEDEPTIQDMISIALDAAGFNCLSATTVREAHVLVIDNQPDLILLDWMLPGSSGIEFARRLKQDDHTANIPIIMLTAKTSEDNKVQGLEAGADDYITKPFSPRELIARIRALLRRMKGLPQEKILEAFDLQLDPSSHRITVRNKQIIMGPTEFRLLKFFMSHPEKVFDRDSILNHVWGGNVYLDERTIDVHIRRLRKALGTANSDEIHYPSLVQTVRGVGYRFSLCLPE